MYISPLTRGQVASELSPSSRCAATYTLPAATRYFATWFLLRASLLSLAACYLLLST